MNNFLQKTAQVIDSLKEELIRVREENKKLKGDIHQKNASARMEKVRQTFPGDEDLISKLASIEDEENNLIDHITGLKKSASFGKEYDNNRSVGNSNLQVLRESTYKSFLS